MTQRIAYPDNPLMAAAWYAAVRHAATEPRIVAVYERDSGHRFVLSRRRSPIDEMIDHATGYESASIDDFVDWFNEKVWGEDPFSAEDMVD